MNRVRSLTLALIGFAGLTAMPAFAQVSAPIRAAPPEQGYASANLNVRQGPATRFRVVGSVARGDVLDIERCERNWCLVSAPGLRGWSSQRLIGFGPNPVHRGPQLADPGIPRQERGTVYE